MYKYEKEVSVSPEKVFGDLSAELKKYGFVVLSYVDVRDIVRRKLNEDFPYYFILDVCKPKAAKEMITKNSDYGLLLPCKVVITGTPERSTISMLRISEVAEEYLHEPRGNSLTYEEEIIRAIESL